jgi:hypothetical protein
VLDPPDAVSRRAGIAAELRQGECRRNSAEALLKTVSELGGSLGRSALE